MPLVQALRDDVVGVGNGSLRTHVSEDLADARVGFADLLYCTTII